MTAAQNRSARHPSARPPRGWRALLGTFDWRRELPLAGATVALLFGLFAAWQSWELWQVQQAVAALTPTRVQAAQNLGGLVADLRKRIALALQDPAVQADMSNGSSAAAQARLHALLPQASRIELFGPDLNEVLRADYARFGYAKAAQLVRAQSIAAMVRFEVRGSAGRQTLGLAAPLQDGAHLLGYAWIEYPFTLLQARFDALPAPHRGGRLELRQQGVLLLAHGGSAQPGAEDAGLPVPGSALSVRALPPNNYVVLTESLPLALLWVVLGFGGGIVLLWLRRRVFGATSFHFGEPTLADVMREQPQTAPKAPVVAKAATPTPTASAAPVALDRSIFRAYDIRGVVGTQLSAEIARLLGQAIGNVMREKNLGEIVIGRDGRLSGAELVAALGEGLRDAGCHVIDLGAVPTPVVYFAGFLLNTGCGVAVTGSHNPPEYNGFKIVVGGETLSEDAIQDLYARISEGRLKRADGGGLRQQDVGADYIERISGDVQLERPLKIVVDCGNGIPGAFAPQLLQAIGAEVIPLYCEVDGTFPNHHPDPSDPRNLEDLMLSVKRMGADLGVAFDGDGDRLGVVTPGGENIFPDRLLMLFAADVLTRDPGAVVIYDVKCTGHLAPAILRHGGVPLMWRTGHSLIKAKMRETEAALAGEMSGHFFFRERWYGFDDGMYAAARLLEILAADPERRAPVAILAALPRDVSTPELKIALAEGEHYTFIEQFRHNARFEGGRISLLDGVRVDWPDGFGLVRASNTTPVLVLRFAADTPEGLQRIQETFRAQLLAQRVDLRLPF